MLLRKARTHGKCSSQRYWFLLVRSVWDYESTGQNYEYLIEYYMWGAGERRQLRWDYMCKKVCSDWGTVKATESHTLLLWDYSLAYLQYPVSCPLSTTCSYQGCCIQSFWAYYGVCDPLCCWTIRHWVGTLDILGLGCGPLNLSTGNHNFFSPVLNHG